MAKNPQKSAGSLQFTDGLALLVIPLGLASQIKIFGEAPPAKVQSELKIVVNTTEKGGALYREQLFAVERH
jgi:hypothetical protein